MIDANKSISAGTSVRVAPADEAIERLVTAWLRWDANSGSHAVAVERLAALAALNLPSSEAHDYIAAARRAGFDIPSAVTRAVNDLGSRCAG